MFPVKQRTIALLLCLLLLLAGCGREEPEVALAGTWEAEVSLDVLGFDADIINGQAKCELEIFEDGSCTYRLTGENFPEQNVTLRYQTGKDTLTFLASNGGFAEWGCQLEADKLTLTKGDCQSVFTRK